MVHVYISLGGRGSTVIVTCQWFMFNICWSAWEGVDCKSDMSMVHFSLSLGGRGSTVIGKSQCFMSL